MSYILEALKKAQAERQLGSAPTIHALPIQPLQAGHAGPNRAPLIAGAALAVIAASVVFVIFWKKDAPPVAVAAAPAPAVVTQPVLAQAAPIAPMAAPAPAPVVLPKAPVVQTPPVVRPQPQPQPQPLPVVEARRASPAPATVPEAPEEMYPLLRELPEALQRDVPRVAIGGYIYSKNPADRLLLVDKVLRREGEDVGSGQILEKLQSKAAIMNFRGTRYRIPY